MATQTTSRPFRRLLAALVAAAIVTVGWGLGTGRIAFVVTNGVSMHPVYYAGDLVVVARSTSYGPGQIVAYHGGQNGHLTVLHRIIGGDPAGFVVKGDNNQSIDPTHPATAQIIGRAVLHIPKVGAATQSPIVRSLFAVVVLALVGLFVMNRRPQVTRAHQPLPNGDRTRTVWKALLVLDAVLVVALGVVFAIGSASRRPAQSPYTQTASLSYRADVLPSDTYPTGKITTGDPVFTRVVDSVAVAFRYRSNAPSTSIHGSAQLFAILDAPSGWHSTMKIADSAPVTAGTADVAGTLDLARIQSLAASVAKATGVPTSTIDVTVIGSADMSVNGAAAVPFNSQLQLHLSAAELTLTGARPQASADGPAVISTVALAPHVEVKAGASTQVAHRVRLPLVAVIMVALGGTVIVWPPSKSARKASPQRVTTRAVSVRPAATTQIRVADHDAIVRLAADLACPIIEGANGWEAVASPGALYWTVTTAPSAESAVPGPAAVARWQHLPSHGWATAAGSV